MTGTISANTNVLLRTLLLLATLFNFIVCNNNRSSGIACIETERQALLSFKQDLVDHSNRLASWDRGANCCDWVGVVCSNSTGHIVELDLHDQGLSLLRGTMNPSLLNLKHLMYLDLSSNAFGGAQIPTFFASIGSLRRLDLSSSGFTGKVPPQFHNLTELRHLSLGGNNLYVNNLQWLSGLSFLQFLVLGDTNVLFASSWLQMVNTLPSLEVLFLDGCQLGQIPSLPLVNNLSSLSDLVLSFNDFDNSLIPGWIFCLSNLNLLDLGGNNFRGPLPDGLRNLTHLSYLDLSRNHFNSLIPSWFYSFSSRLEYLSLRNNNLQGLISSTIGNLTSVNSLDLSYNDFQIDDLKSSGRLSNLRVLDLSNNKLNQDVANIFYALSPCLSNRLESLDLGSTGILGTLTNVTFGHFKDLKDLMLGNNSISGAIPLSFGKLQSLELVDLSDNLLKGIVSELHFANLTRLALFSASGNKQLKLQVSPSWIPPFQLRLLLLGSWQLGPQFPPWLHTQNNLEFLDLSNCGITSTIPQWFWNLTSQFEYMNLSNNQITGEIQSINHTAIPVDYAITIDLSSNNLQGQVPPFSSNVAALDLSKNSFTGSLSHFLCYKMNESKKMMVINLGDNSLTGEIPNCWTRWKSLVAIKMNNNILTGQIPNSIGNLDRLQSLHIRNNILKGEVPMSLGKCTYLVIIDLAENQLQGLLSTWINEDMSNLTILDLRSNKFYGEVPEELCTLTALQILDLALNNLSGFIPHCINKFNAMITLNNSVASQSLVKDVVTLSGHPENAILVMKGKVMEYGNTLNLVRVVDLSNNFLSGKIPEEITTLVALQSLNLSHNLFTGRIPQNIGAMRAIESLDLSMNMLSGEIPQSISSLTFLSHLNFSSNNLTGRIPSSTQLQSLNASCFVGNELCGPPLTQDCNASDKAPTSSTASGDTNAHDEVEWFYVSMAVGFVVGFWSVVGLLVYSTHWRLQYFSLLDRTRDKFWGFSISITSSVKRKFCY